MAFSTADPSVHFFGYSYANIYLWGSYRGVFVVVESPTFIYFQRASEQKEKAPHNTPPVLIDTIIPVMYLTFTSNTELGNLAFFFCDMLSLIEQLKQGKQPKSNLSAITNVSLWWVASSSGGETRLVGILKLQRVPASLSAYLTTQSNACLDNLHHHCQIESTIFFYHDYYILW